MSGGGSSPAMRPAPPDVGERRRIYLHAGQIVAAREPSAVTTILGSCVAACVWDPARGVGGLTHYLLPQWAGRGASSARFGNVAMAALFEELVLLGARRSALQAKVFGGACVLEGLRGTGTHLGMKNVELALSVLAENRIPVLARDVGGSRGRKLVFQTDNGESWIQKL